MKISTALVFFAFVFFAAPSLVSAQMMDGFRETNPQVETKEESKATEGKLIWDKLQNKETECQTLNDSDFGKLGEFFTQNMMGGRTEVMEKLMEERLGEEGEEQMNVVMGKRLSGCDATAQFPEGAGYFSPMMGGYGGMMGRGYANTFADKNYNSFPMMSGNYWNGGRNDSFMSLVGWVVQILFFGLGSVYFLKGMTQKTKK